MGNVWKRRGGPADEERKEGEKAKQVLYNPVDKGWTLVMLGGLIASTGLGLCFLANSVQFLVITQGVAVGNYFVKRRAMAAPIGNTGGSIGGLVMPLVTRLLLEEYAALDILSRLVPGFVAQMKWMKPQRMLSIAFLIEGVVFQFTSLFNSLPLMVLLAVVHGLCAGVFVSMLQLIIIDFVGLQRFPQTFGFTQLFLGLSGATFFPLLAPGQ
nr:hypothetical protein BaRGS_014405 [Batillaria attramentaria]